MMFGMTNRTITITQREKGDNDTVQNFLTHIYIYIHMQRIYASAI